MRYLPFLLLLISSFLFFQCTDGENNLNLENQYCKLTIDQNGFVIHLVDIRTEQEFISIDTPSPLLSLRIDSILHHPNNATFSENRDFIRLQYDSEITATVRVESKESHFTFEIAEIQNPELIELAVWGPFQTTIKEIIGETVGVVQDSLFSAGLQALNPKTLGGYPWTDNDCMPQINIFAQDDLSDMKEGEGKDYVLYRVEAAKPTNYGSSLQAYCRNRHKERVINNLAHDHYISPVFKDGGIIGSKIAIFGVPRKQTLETLGKIELAENLPHPKINGTWTKSSPLASSAYIIMGFGKDNIDKAINITKRAGLQYLYHDGPFENWGHFELRKNQFPTGVEDLQFCVEKAKAEGIYVGLHTLSNFITTNDPLVSPVPDKGLAMVGSAILTADINEEQKEIPISSPKFFNQFKNNHLKTIHIGDELIRYEKVSESTPWKLLNCERGAFNTISSSHAANETVRKLIDHGYKVFLTDNQLSETVSKRIAQLYNETGLRQISFDGLEGNRSTGMGNYGEILFTKNWYDNINEDIKSHFIADASRTSHYFWHIYTRMNWGEPWYAGFRESQTAYRLKNQAYFKRNLMPAMLGWFRMTDKTSIEDVEWMLARSAGFGAGYGFVVDYMSLENNHMAESILASLGLWEKARIGGLFTESQKELMQDISNEFELSKLDEHNLNLRHINSLKFSHAQVEKQPGEPTFSTFSFDQGPNESPFIFHISARKGMLSQINMEIDNFKRILLPFSLNEGETLKYMGENKFVVYNQNWEILKTQTFDFGQIQISPGGHNFTFNCDFRGTNEGTAAIELRLINKDEIIPILK